MNRDNLVRFYDSARGRSARRGAADKLPFDGAEQVEVECPRCFARLCLEVGPLGAGPEIFCDQCDSKIAFRDRAPDVRSW